MTRAVDVAIVGAGPSGLTCAWELSRQGRSVAVFESTPRVGGNVWTVHEKTDEGSWLLECGPNSFGDAPGPLRALITDLGLDDALLPARTAAGQRLLYLDGRLQVVPKHPLKLLTSSVLPLRARLRLLREPFISKRPATAEEREESLAAFCDRRLGIDVRKRLLTPVVGGIYAGDPERLGAASAFPQLVAMEQTHGSLFSAARKGARPAARGQLNALDGGLSRLTDALAASLGTAVRVSSPVLAIEHQTEHQAKHQAGRFIVHVGGENSGARANAGAVVLACPPRPAARLLRPLCAAAADPLDAVESPPLTVVHVGVPRNSECRIPDGFGFLVPREQGLRILGAIFSSRLFVGRAPDGFDLLTVFVGGALDPDGATLAPPALRTAVMGDLRTALPGLPEPVLYREHRWERSIPQYTLGHDARMERMDAALAATAGLHVCSNVRGGIALPQCIGAARALGAQLGRAGVAPRAPGAA